MTVMFPPLVQQQWLNTHTKLQLNDISAYYTLYKILSIINQYLIDMIPNLEQETHKGILHVQNLLPSTLFLTGQLTHNSHRIIFVEFPQCSCSIWFSVEPWLSLSIKTTRHLHSYTRTIEVFYSVLVPASLA